MRRDFHFETQERISSQPESLFWTFRNTTKSRFWTFRRSQRFFTGKRFLCSHLFGGVGSKHKKHKLISKRVVGTCCLKIGKCEFQTPKLKQFLVPDIFDLYSTMWTKLLRKKGLFLVGLVNYSRYLLEFK